MAEELVLKLENRNIKEQNKKSSLEIEKLNVKVAMLQKLTDNQMNLLHDFEKEMMIKEELIK